MPSDSESVPRDADDVQLAGVSVDVLALQYHRPTRQVMVAVHPRATEPFAGHLALPGVLLRRGERLTEAALRAAHDKLGLNEEQVAAVGQLATYDEPHSDPRGPSLSVSMWVSVPPEVELGRDGSWVDLCDVPELAFDHGRIIADSRPRLGQLLWRSRSFTETLTGRQFPVADAYAIAAALSGLAPDRGNLNRQLRGTPGLRRTAEVLQVYGVGRPSSMWAWDA